MVEISVKYDGVFFLYVIRYFKKSDWKYDVPYLQDQI